MIKVETSITEQLLASVDRIAQSLSIPRAAAVRICIQHGAAHFGPDPARTIPHAAVRDIQHEAATGRSVPHNNWCQLSFRHDNTRPCPVNGCADPENCTRDS